jgi:hypothetical protein
MPEIRKLKNNFPPDSPSPPEDAYRGKEAATLASGGKRLKNRKNWLEVDRDGLRQLVEKRGKGFILMELIQNALDEDPQRVNVTLSYPDHGKSLLVVEDFSPTGYRDLEHAWTVFAPSYKKGDPEKRGAFNLGEKLVLSLCHSATIITTTGGVEFTKDGRRRLTRNRPVGTEFSATIPLTVAEYDEVYEVVHRLIAPIPVYFNHALLPNRTPLKEFSVTLPTHQADTNGVLRVVKRATNVRVYAPLEHERPTLYELGIPVVEIDANFHISVQQKLPLNMERDNVPPSYRRAVQVAVLNAMSATIGEETDPTAPWVQAALTDPRVSEETVVRVLDAQFGPKRATENPFDPEANHNAVAAGYTLIPGRSFSADAWDNIRKFNAAPSSTVVTPAPKPFSEDGTPLKLVPPDQWNTAMHRFARFARAMALVTIGRSVDVRFTNDRSWRFHAAYRPGVLYVNHALLGSAFFSADLKQSVPGFVDLLTHEFAHENSSSHLDEKYHEACTKIAGQVAVWLLHVTPDEIERVMSRI